MKSESGNETTARGNSRWPSAVLISAMVIVVADQLTKWWALNELTGRTPIDLVGSLRFNLAFNSGTAFSLGSGLGPFIAVLAVLISLALVWASRAMTRTSALLAAGLVVGGAIGNFLDRAFRAPRVGTSDGFLSGSVVDFIDLQWWPIFNIADSGIVVGGLLIVVLGGFGEPVSADAKADSPAESGTKVSAEKAGAPDSRAAAESERSVTRLSGDGQDGQDGKDGQGDEDDKDATVVDDGDGQPDAADTPQIPVV